MSITKIIRNRSEGEHGGDGGMFMAVNAMPRTRESPMWRLIYIRAAQTIPPPPTAISKTLSPSFLFLFFFSSPLPSSAGLRNTENIDPPGSPSGGTRIIRIPSWERNISLDRSPGVEIYLRKIGRIISGNIRRDFAECTLNFSLLGREREGGLSRS